MKWPQFPPLQRRVVAVHPSKSKKVQLIEQVKILPFDGGLAWFPVRNLTKSLVALEEALSSAEKQLEDLKSRVTNETKYINKELDRIGFYADTSLVKDPVTGDFKMIDVRALVDFRLGNERHVVGSDKKAGVRKESFVGLLIETRRPSNNNNNQKNANQNNNQKNN